MLLTRFGDDDWIHVHVVNSYSRMKSLIGKAWSLFVSQSLAGVRYWDVRWSDVRRRDHPTRCTLDFRI
jgi:hypothetical protein